METCLGSCQHSSSTFRAVRVEQAPTSFIRWRGESEGMPDHHLVATSPGSRPSTMVGSWQHWVQGCRCPREGELSVVGTALKIQGPRSLGLLRYKSNLGYCFPCKNKGVWFSFGTQGSGTRTSGDRSARAAQPKTSVPWRMKAPPTTTVPLKSAQVKTGLRCDPRACWTVRTVAESRPQKSRVFSARGHLLHEWPSSETTSLSSVALSDTWDEGLNGGSKFVEDLIIPFTSCVRLVSHFLKPEKPTKAAMRLMERTVEVLKLDKQIKEAQIQQKAVLEETRLLLNEKFNVQADTKFMLDHLTNKTKEYRREINRLWDNYAQESGEIQRRRQELASKYAKQTSEIQKQLLEKAKKEFDLKQQLKALRDISLIKEKQDRELQTLQEELKVARAETNAKVYAQYLQEEASLEKQLSEPYAGLLGETERKELKRKAQALELEAERCACECCCNLSTENQQLNKELAQECQQYRKVHATRSRLQNQKQELQQKQWYTECLTRGRRQLQQSAPKATRPLP